ncbi:histidine phosphatase family protein [Pseudomonas sp. Xaverov 259]|uniref:histidine phosphatase family protein n=1 Tax=Pseudomonas sp. Xaverov 259 TaxID=2666086 RepID=UPI001C5A78FA|nr:histidine phosphatase family protein [Pseudomonas sp. Xaverov 259]
MHRLAVSKIMAVVGLAGLMTISYVILAKERVNELGTVGGLESLELIQAWKNGDMAVLIRHEERCDQSSNPCFGPSDGITAYGSERAKRTGEKISTHLGLGNVDVFTSPKVRTVQTAHFMSVDAKPLASRHTLCGKDIIRRVAEHKRVGRSLMLVTHSTCINNLIKSAGYRKEGKPEYGSLLFVKFLPGGEMKVVGKVNIH